MGEVVIKGGFVKINHSGVSKNGSPFAFFSLGVSKRSKVEDKWVTEAQGYFSCAAFGAHAEVLEKLKPGAPLIVSGRIEPAAAYTDKKGETRDGGWQITVNNLGFDLSRMSQADKVDWTVESGKRSKGANKKAAADDDAFDEAAIQDSPADDVTDEDDELFEGLF